MLFIFGFLCFTSKLKQRGKSRSNSRWRCSSPDGRTRFTWYVAPVSSHRAFQGLANSALDLLITSPAVSNPVLRWSSETPSGFRPRTTGFEFHVNHKFSSSFSSAESTPSTTMPFGCYFPCSCGVQPSFVCKHNIHQKRPLVRCLLLLVYKHNSRE